MLKTGKPFISLQRRWITIQQPINTSILATEGSTSNPATEAKGLELDQELITEPHFETIGSTNQSTLKITLPASIPVHVKSGSVMATFPSSSIVSSSIPNLNNYISGMKFQKIMSTIPVRVLVSAYTPSDLATNKSFVNIILDGSKDWIVLNGRSIQAYSGDDIELIHGKFPSEKWTDKPLKYVLVKGRGLCGLVGSGDVFKVSIDKGESLQVRTNELLAMSTSNISLLGRIEKSVWKNGFQTGSQTGKNELPALNVEKLDDYSTLTEKCVYYAKNAINSTIKIGNFGKERVMNYIFGNGEYYTINGPRTILIESGSGSSIFGHTGILEGLQNKQDVSYVEQFVQKAEEFQKPAGKVGDNLGVISIINGKVTGYKNVDSFKEEADRIESLKK